MTEEEKKELENQESPEEKPAEEAAEAEPQLEAKEEKNRPPASVGEGSISDEMPRRSFFSWLTVAWLAFAAATGGFLAMTVRFLFPNVLFEPPQSFKIGYPDDYQIGQVNIRWKKLHAIWVVRTTEHIYALSTVCTHLGCTPNWLDNERKFKCPCHGSGFRKSGVNFEGPAPRPLERFKIALADDGQILVDKSKLFQYEKGQWDDPESFLKV
jgi:cytochrome b6-f complex iron-sulfur subunit